MGSVAASTLQPITERIHCRDAVAEQFTKELVARYAELNNQFTTNTSAARTEDIKQELLTDMCQKLASSEWI
jgi:hypothetical protein